MWKHGYNLVLMPASCDQRADSFTPSQVMQQLELVLYPHWAAGNIDLFYSDKPALRLAALIMAGIQCRNIRSSLEGRGCPLRGIPLFHIPIVLIVFVVQVFGLVDG